MTFFSRPNLEDIQFRQEVGSTLTLSGQTRIATTTGLTLHNDSIGTTYPNVTITAEAADSHVGDVLTYDGAGKIKLMPSSGGGGDPTYNPPYLSPASVSLCGITAGFVLTGKTLSCIIQTLLVPTLNPVLTAPSSIFSVPLSNPYEVGTVVNAVGTTTLNKGSINPQYTSASPYRSCGAVSHNYVDFNGGTCTCTVPVTTLTCSYAMPAYSVVAGVRTAYGSVTYKDGVQPKNSAGGNYSTPLPVGTTPTSPAVICGLYPYFWGKVASGGAPIGVNRPTPTCALVIGGNKVVSDSSGAIAINFNSTSDDYIWFATPNSSATKTCWCVTALNNGCIGGAVSAGGNLFPAYASVNPVATICWAGQTYKVYVSNYQSAANTLMTLS